nr:hypothetical protein [Sphingobium sp. TCM1]
MDVARHAQLFGGFAPAFVQADEIAAGPPLGRALDDDGVVALFPERDGAGHPGDPQPDNQDPWRHHLSLSRDVAGSTPLFQRFAPIMRSWQLQMT